MRIKSIRCQLSALSTLERIVIFGAQVQIIINFGKQVDERGRVARQQCLDFRRGNEDPETRIRVPQERAVMPRSYPLQR